MVYGLIVTGEILGNYCRYRSKTHLFFALQKEISDPGAGIHESVLSPLDKSSIHQV